MGRIQGQVFSSYGVELVSWELRQADAIIAAVARKCLPGTIGRKALPQAGEERSSFVGIKASFGGQATPESEGQNVAPVGTTNIQSTLTQC